MDRPSKQKIIKVTVALKTINVTDIYRLFHWTAVNRFFPKPTWNTHQDRPSVQFSHSVVSNSLRPHGLQHARPLCPSPTSGVYPNSCPLSRWCHPTISSSVIPFSARLQSFPASGSFQMSQLFTSGGQSIRISTSTSFRMDWLDLLAVQRTQEFSATPQFKRIHSSALSFLYRPTLAWAIKPS